MITSILLGWWMVIGFYIVNRRQIYRYTVNRHKCWLSQTFTITLIITFSSSHSVIKCHGYLRSDNVLIAMNMVTSRLIARKVQSAESAQALTELQNAPETKGKNVCYSTLLTHRVTNNVSIGKKNISGWRWQSKTLRAYMKSGQRLLLQEEKTLETLDCY